MTATYLGTTHEAGLKAAVFFCFLYIFWWCFFIDATQYVYVNELSSANVSRTQLTAASYIAEIFPNHLRSAGVALGLSSFYLASEVTLVAAPIALNSVGWKFYLVLICPSAFYLVAIYFLFPETKGRTLEEIGALFGDTHIANHWYGLTEEERNRIHEEALNVTKGGKYDGENVPPEKVNVQDIKDDSVKEIEGKQE
jgi:hypothetical protein